MAYAFSPQGRQRRQPLALDQMSSYMSEDRPLVTKNKWQHHKGRQCAHMSHWAEAKDGEVIHLEWLEQPQKNGYLGNPNHGTAGDPLQEGGRESKSLAGDGLCCGLNVCVPPAFLMSYSSPPKMIALVVGLLGGCLSPKYSQGSIQISDHESGTLMNTLSTLWTRFQRAPQPLLPHEDTTRSLWP